MILFMCCDTESGYLQASSFPSFIILTDGGGPGQDPPPGSHGSVCSDSCQFQLQNVHKLMVTV